MNFKWICNVVNKFCEISRRIDMRSVQSRVAATRFAIQNLRLILLCTEEEDRKHVVECVVKRIMLSDCDVTKFLFSRALRSVVMLTSQKVSNNVKSKMTKKEAVSCKICNTSTNRTNRNWWKCRVCPSVFVCNACMSSSIRGKRHHDENHEMIRCIPVSPKKTMTVVKTTTKMTRSKSKKKRKEWSFVRLFSQVQYLVIGMFERVASVLSDHTSNADRFLSLLMQIHTSTMSVDVVLHQHAESWISIAEKMKDSRMMSLISRTLCVLARRGIFPKTTEQAEMLLGILYHSAERWVDTMSRMKTHQADNVLCLRDKTHKVSCLHSVFLCIASIQKRNLLKKRSPRWLSLVYRAMRHNVDCGRGVDVLLLELCEKRSEYRSLKDLTTYCKLLPSIFEMGKTYVIYFIFFTCM